MNFREQLANELDVQFNAANQSHRMRWLAVADLVIAKINTEINAARTPTDSDATTAPAAADGSSLQTPTESRSTES